MMKRTMGWGAVAMASIGTIALLASEAPRPHDTSSEVSTDIVARASPGLQGRATVQDLVVDGVDPAVLQIPMVTIVGSRRGSAEMQPAEDTVLRSDGGASRE
jgi:hypothetical protein